MELSTSLFSAIIVAFMVSTTLHPFVIYLFKRYLTHSKSENGFRQMHQEPTPRFGGIAIVIGFWLTIGVLLTLKVGLANTYFLHGSQLSSILWLIGLSLCVFALGFLDDLIDIKARYKLIPQLLIALIASLTIIPIQTISFPLFGWGEVTLGIFGIMLTTIWIVGVMNAFNLIDGLDSLAGGVAIISLLGVAVPAWLHHDLLYLTLSLTLIASISGFLVFNFHPAKIFMGDGGSLFLGFMLAILPTLQIKSETGLWSTAPILLLGVPLVDTLFSILRRFLRGVPLFSADKNHIHHKLIAKGLNQNQSVSILHLVSFGYLSIFLATTGNYIDVKLGIIAFLALSWLLVFYAGYDEVVKPLRIIKDRSSNVRDRSFFMNLSENIDLFYQKSTTVENIFLVLEVWAEQAQAKRVTLFYHKRTLTKSILPQKNESNYSKLAFKKNGVKIEILFDPTFFDLDSDIKFETLNKTMDITLNRLLELTRPKLVVLNSSHHLP